MWVSSVTAIPITPISGPGGPAIAAPPAAAKVAGVAVALAEDTNSCGITVGFATNTQRVPLSVQFPRVTTSSPTTFSLVQFSYSKFSSVWFSLYLGCYLLSSIIIL